MGIIGFLAVPLGYVMRAIYGAVQNYGVAIILFTALVKVCLLPLTIHQQKSTAKMSVFSPMIQDIQKKYAKDQERAQAQADDARDEGELALEDAALHGKVAHQLNGGAHQHHAAQGVADHVEGGGGPHEQEDAQPQVEHAHQDQIPFQLLCHKRSRSFLVPDGF